MNCRTCGIVAPAGSAFCPNCGTPMPRKAFSQESSVNPDIPIPPATSPPAGTLPPPYTAPPPQLYGATLQNQPAPAQYQPYAALQAPQVPPPPPPPTFYPGRYDDASRLQRVGTPAEKPVAMGHEAGSPHEHMHAQTDTPDAHEEHEENANERIILFSDGVIAFAITIAAISIKIPTDPALLQAQTGSIVLKYFTYIISFVIVALCWNEHHRLFHYINRNDMTLVILNFVFLGCIVAFPIGLYFVEVTGDASSAFLFLGSQFGAFVALPLIWWYATRRRRLVDPEINPRLVTYMTLRLLVYPIALIILFIAASVPIVGLLGLIFLIGGLIYRRYYRRGLDISHGSNNVGRILLFSDAVIGIAITIIAAQIEFPSFSGDVGGAELQRVFTESQPLLLAYAVGFVVMGAYWLFHYRMFRYINRHNPWLIFFNFCFLLCIALMFIPINIYAAYSDNTASGFFFGLWQILTSLVLVVTWWYASRKRRLLDPGLTNDQIRRFGTRLVGNLVIFFVLTLISSVLAIAPVLYLCLYLATIGLAMLTVHFFGRRRHKEVQPA